MEKIYTIPVNEAFDASAADKSCGCPFCALYNGLEKKETDAILGAAMMEPDIRIETNKKGFCRTHYDLMFGYKNRLGLALIFQRVADVVQLVGVDSLSFTDRLKLETAKATREELAALFEGARVILADALCTLCGAPPAEPRDEQALRAVLGSRLTKAQILGTIELLETYRNHCEYNVGVGPLLGGLAVELEEIL